MLLIIRCAGYPRNNSKDRAKPIVCAVDRVGHPTAPAPMPAFALQDLVQRRARIHRRRHSAKRPRVSFFFKRAFSQKFLNILFASERALGLIVKFRFLLFFRRFHPPNRDLRSGDFVPPTVEPARKSVSVNGLLCAKLNQLVRPTLRMAIFRFRHAQKYALTFVIAFALCKFAIRLCSLDLRLPIALRDFDRLLTIFLLGGHAGLMRDEQRFPTWPPTVRRRIWSRNQSAGSSAGLMPGPARARSCWAVMINATEPMIRAAAINVRMVTVSPAKKVPSKTATIGFTY